MCSTSHHFTPILLHGQPLDGHTTPQFRLKLDKSAEISVFETRTEEWVRTCVTVSRECILASRTARFPPNSDESGLDHTIERHLVEGGGGQRSGGGTGAQG